MIEEEIAHYKVLKFVYALIFGKIVGNYCDQGWITDEQLLKSAEVMKKNNYGKYLKKVYEKGRK